MGDAQASLTDMLIWLWDAPVSQVLNQSPRKSY